MVWGALLLFVGLTIGLFVGRLLWQKSAPPVESPVEPPTPSADVDRYLEQASAIVSAVHEDGHEPLTKAVSALASAAWTDGVNELRDQLLENSGLPPSMMDQLCRLALEALGSRRGE